MTEKTDLAQVKRLADGFDVLDHVGEGLVPGIFEFGRLAGAALVDEHEPAGAHERQQVRKEVIVRGTGSAVDDHQGRAASYTLVVDQSAVAVHEALLDGKQVQGLGGLGRTSQTSGANEEEDKQAGSHAEMLARRIHQNFLLL